MNSITHYSSYQQFIEDKLESLCATNSQYSLRAFAKRLAMSPSHLSKVLNGKKGLSVEAAATLAEKFEMDELETSYFCDLVQAAHGRTATVRRLAMARLEQQRQAPDVTTLQLDVFRIISDWWHYAILELTFCKDFQSDAKWIAQRLGINYHEAKAAIERLKRIEFLEEENGTLKKAIDTIDTPAEMQSEAVQKYNKQILALAEQSVEEQKPEDRVLAAMTMAINKEKLPEARKRMIEFKHELLELLTEGEQTHVYTLASQLFELKDLKK